MIRIHILPDRLSDRSIVWNVHIGGLRLPAIDAPRATLLAAAIADAINEHTTEVAEVRLGGLSYDH